MRRARRLCLVAFLGMMFSLPVALRADHSTGTGFIAGSPALFAALLGAGQRGWFLIAYRLPDGSAARIYAYETYHAVGIAPHDDVLVDSSAVRVEWDTSRELWNVWVTADLPEIGAVRLQQVSPYTAGGSTCAGWWNYSFQRSPTGVLVDAGNVYGSIDGQLITRSFCEVGGQDLYGYFAAPPVTKDISE